MYYRCLTSDVLTNFGIFFIGMSRFSKVLAVSALLVSGVLLSIQESQAQYSYGPIFNKRQRQWLKDHSNSVIGYQIAGDSYIGYEWNLRFLDRFGAYQSIGIVGGGIGLKYYFSDDESASSISTGARTGSFRPFDRANNALRRDDEVFALIADFTVSIDVSANLRLFNFSRYSDTGVELKIGVGHVVQRDIEFELIEQYNPADLYVFLGLGIAY